MSIAPSPEHQRLQSHEDGRIVCRNDRRRERSLGDSEHAKLDGAAMPENERPEIAAGAVVKWCMLHSSTFSTYDTEEYVQ